MNPPLRSAADREALIEAIKDGTIDMIATDHAPHSAEEKAKPLTEAPSGIIGLETSLPLAVTRLVKAGHIDYLTLFEKNVPESGEAVPDEGGGTHPRGRRGGSGSF